MVYLDLFKALVYTAVFSLLLTPLDFKLAKSIGAIDTPKDDRRMHTRPVPRIGGISIFAAFSVFGLAFCESLSNSLLCILTGAVIIVVLGIIDDCVSLSAKTKLTVQTVSAVITVSGMGIYRNMGGIFVIFGILWLLTLTNAHNFIDGLDGLCAGTVIAEACALAVLFFIQGEYTLALLALTLTGACIGFIPYNEKNAKIFMGDTGSAFLGFIIGFLSLELFRLSPTPRAFISMCMICAVPLSDIIFAVSRRIWKGKSPFIPDRSHIHHLLADRTLGHRNASLIIRLFSLIFAVFGMILYTVFGN